MFFFYFYYFFAFIFCKECFDEAAKELELDDLIIEYVRDNFEYSTFR